MTATSTPMPAAEGGGPTNPLLEVDALSVAYGEARAVFDVSFRLDSGRVIALLGANGAGKTSLAAAIVGVVRPASGRVRLGGVDVTRWPTHRISRAGVAYVPEGRGIYPHLTVIDNLRAMLRYAVPKDERAQALDRAIEHFPLLGRRRKQAGGNAVGRGTADARTGAGPRRPAEVAHRRRDVARSRPDDGRPRVREPRPGQGGGGDGAPCRAVRRTGARARRRRDRAVAGSGRVGRAPPRRRAPPRSRAIWATARARRPPVPSPTGSWAYPPACVRPSRRRRAGGAPCIPRARCGSARRVPPR